MDAMSSPLLVAGQSLEELEETLHFALREAAEELRLVLMEAAGGLAASLAPFRGEGQTIGPAVVRIALATEKFALLQGIDDGHHGGAVDAEHLGGLLLRERSVLGEEREQTVLAGGEVERVERSADRLVDPGADPAKKKHERLHGRDMLV
jgi:hypothetical protein